MANVEELLAELQTNLLDDGLNFSDPSVGIFSYSNLKEWEENELPHLEGITLVSCTEEKAIILVEGEEFEIYLHSMLDGEEVVDSIYRIRHLPKTLTAMQDF